MLDAAKGEGGGQRRGASGSAHAELGQSTKFGHAGGCDAIVVKGQARLAVLRSGREPTEFALAEITRKLQRRMVFERRLLK